MLDYDSGMRRYVARQYFASSISYSEFFGQPLAIWSTSVSLELLRMKSSFGRLQSSLIAAWINELSAFSFRVCLCRFHAIRPRIMSAFAPSAMYLQGGRAENEGVYARFVDCMVMVRRNERHPVDSQVLHDAVLSV